MDFMKENLNCYDTRHNERNHGQFVCVTSIDMCDSEESVMKIGELEVGFEPYELPEDYKFVYKISCEPKISPNQDITTIAQKIIGVRVKMFDEMTKELLKQIAEEKGYSEILVIDESKVDKFVKALKALEIIVKKANVRLYERNGRYYFKTTNNLYEISKEKYDLLKEVFNK